VCICKIAGTSFAAGVREGVLAAAAFAKAKGLSSGTPSRHVPHHFGATCGIEVLCACCIALLLLDSMTSEQCHLSSSSSMPLVCLLSIAVRWHATIRSIALAGSPAPLLTLNGVVLEAPPGASPSALMWRQLAGAGLQQEMRQVHTRTRPGLPLVVTIYITMLNTRGKRGVQSHHAWTPCSEAACYERWEGGDSTLGFPKPLHMKP
jgi:hypothetical protein